MSESGNVWGDNSDKTASSQSSLESTHELENDLEYKI